MLGAASLLLVLLATTGCASLMQGASAADDQARLAMADATPAGQQLENALEQTDGSTVVTLKTSPWGSMAQVAIEPSYFAASGRWCRQLVITPSNGVRKQALACETGSGWITHDLVTATLSAGGY